ncbi:MAG: DNA-binding response regulator [Cellulomonas sp. 73-92]|uniref:response regulator transcription factor n=1 Tax=Cellulomonas sp. 73-92 TaxID=1895740 RepID=UPI000928F9B7|nr:response regulator transcription factor [Cellulomonas sp. 73-92]OJV78501.1 MAG: DNA-binding response regulator [Cellulomonas sp. 73-92]
MNPIATPPLRVAVVEDQPLYRAMLARTLEAHERLHVVASVGTVAEARAALGTLPVDVAVLDIDLPDGNGIALGVQLRRTHPRLGILLLSAHDAMDLLLDLPKDVSHGWGYLSKTSSTTETLLVEAVTAAAHGQTMLDPALLAGMRPRRGSDVARLTDRQFEVLRLLAQGLSNVGIADRLSITEKSVQNHVNAIYATLDIDANREHNPRVRATLRLLEETGPA